MVTQSSAVNCISWRVNRISTGGGTVDKLADNMYEAHLTYSVGHDNIHNPLSIVEPTNSPVPAFRKQRTDEIGRDALTCREQPRLCF